MCSSSSESRSLASCTTRVSRPRSRRVLYPPGVRKVLPKEDADPTRRWLVLLSTLLFLQIYTEDGLWDAPDGAVQLGDGAGEKPWTGPDGTSVTVCFGLNTPKPAQPQCVVG